MSRRSSFVIHKTYAKGSGNNKKTKKRPSNPGGTPLEKQVAILAAKLARRSNGGT